MVYSNYLRRDLGMVYYCLTHIIFTITLTCLTWALGLCSWTGYVMVPLFCDLEKMDRLSPLKWIQTMTWENPCNPRGSWFNLPIFHSQITIEIPHCWAYPQLGWTLGQLDPRSSSLTAFWSQRGCFRKGGKDGASFGLSQKNDPIIGVKDIHFFGWLQRISSLFTPYNGIWVVPFIAIIFCRRWIFPNPHQDQQKMSVDLVFGDCPWACKPARR